MRSERKKESASERARERWREKERERDYKKRGRRLVFSLCYIQILFSRAIGRTRTKRRRALARRGAARGRRATRRSEKRKKGEEGARSSQVSHFRFLFFFVRDKRGALVPSLSGSPASFPEEDALSSFVLLLFWRSERTERGRERERHTSARKEPTQGANHHCIIMTEGTKANSSADGFGFGKAFQEQIDAASRDYILEPRLGE